MGNLVATQSRQGEREARGSGLFAPRGLENINEPERREAEFEGLRSKLEEYDQWLTQITEVAEQAALGNLEPRLLHCPETEAISRAFCSINHLLDMTDGLLRETGATLQACGEQEILPARATARDAGIVPAHGGGDQPDL